MFKALSQFVVHVADLAEAEGRTMLGVVRQEAREARTAMVSFALMLALLATAVPLAVSGVWLLVFALITWLEPQLGRTMAASIAGSVLLLASGVCVWVVHRCATRRKP